MNGAQATQTRWKVLCCEAVKSLLTVLMIATLAWVFLKSDLPSDAVCAVDRNDRLMRNRNTFARMGKSMRSAEAGLSSLKQLT